MALIEVIQGDITKISIDVIVNAANTSLLGGSGVDGAIHKAGGKKILEECQKIRNKQGGCKVGQAVITNAGNLPAKFVIHTVGPVWNDGENHEEKLLFLAYSNSLKLAIENRARSIAFPNISTGVYNFPKKLACTIALKTCCDFIINHPLKIEKILFVCFDKENYTLYREAINYFINE